jgi:murein DD-endopeptidase MepM/ murein hydrolase activator NlpD
VLNKKYSLPFRGVEVVTVDAPAHRRNSYFRHCIDFFLPQGTPIRAARAGIVVFRESRYSKAFKNEADIDKGNALVLKHADGEHSIYAHLAYRSVKVKVGERVRRGQIVALSGQTGYAWYPHLHFGVNDADGNNIPIVFGGDFERKHIEFSRALKLSRKP